MVRAIVMMVTFLITLLIWECVFYLPCLILRKLKLFAAERAVIHMVSREWSRVIFLVSGVKVSVVGAEHIPQTGALCIVSNHQSVFDIPCLAFHVPRIVGFVAKKELFRFPVFSSWMHALRCIPIDRKSPRDSIFTIDKAAMQIREGHTMSIFPEGTRSVDGTMKPFKNGSLKMALKSDAVILPVTIDGLWRTTPNKRFRVVPCSARCVIHPPVAVASLTVEEKKDLAERLWTIINTGLERNAV